MAGEYEDISNTSSQNQTGNKKKRGTVTWNKPKTIEKEILNQGWIKTTSRSVGRAR